jgi:ketosteroid isomerase-like protein
MVEDGLFVSTDVYEYEDDAAALARFAELSQTPQSADDFSPASWVSKFVAAYNRHDPEAIARLVRDDYVLIDHRANGWETIEGPEALREHHAAAFAISPDASMAIDSVLASDRQVGAVGFSYRGHMVDGGGEFEITMGYVSRLVDGRGASTDVYDPDDRQAMIARYVELGGGLSQLGDKASERILAEWCRHYARRDLEAMMKLLADDFRWIDYRPLSWEPFDREGMRQVTLSAWTEASDIRIEIDEVLAVDDSAIAMRTRFVGTGAQAGAFELPVGQVARYENGVCLSLDQYDYDDTDAMLARFAELSGR